MNHLEGKHVWGQVAKPHDASNKKKYPGLVLLQWASPPYPLQKAWVTDRAAEGWLAVNIEPHDVMPDQPKEYYDALPAELKAYNTIETRNRDKNYFLYMYLADIRAVDYLASRPDWDGKTLVVMGTSMGGQQSLCAAGLHPKVTHMLINVPAGADANGTAHGRKIGYPFWDANDPQVLKTAEYFDTVNCAARIKVPSLVSMGFIDTVTPPVGIWSAFNLLKGPKEAAPMPESPHNHLATPEQSLPWTQRSAAWLGALVAGTVAVRARGCGHAAHRCEFETRARTAAGQAHGRPDRRVFHGRFDHAPLGRDRRAVPGPPRELAREFSRLERRAISAGAPTRRSTCSGACRTASSMASTRRSSCSWRALTMSGRASPLGDADARAAEVARGVAAVVREIRQRAPRATVIITGITPRNDNIAVMPVIDQANSRDRPARRRQVGTLHKHQRAARRFRTGRLRDGMAHDGLHLTVKAYQVWADALKPIFTEILGRARRRGSRTAADRRSERCRKPRQRRRKVRDLSRANGARSASGRISEVSGVHARVRHRASRRSARHQTGVGRTLDRVSPAPRRQHLTRNLRRRPPRAPARRRRRAL